MKKNKITSILICLTLIMTMVLASCSKAPATLEEYVSSNEDAMEEINEAAQEAGVDVSISGNDILYTCEMSNFDGITSDIAKSDVMIESLNSALEEASSSFTSICEDMEEKSSLEGIQVIITYSYDGETIVTKTFNASGVVE